LTYAVVMAGGRGERLWPLSTKERPKQFLNLIGEKTLLQTTVERVLPLILYENVYVIAGREHAGLVSEQLPALPPQNIIKEPMGRGTAPCVGLAAARVSRADPEGVMIVLPADHVVKDKERFLELLEKAATIASEGTHLVTLGITPTYPATGYGYIQAVSSWAEGGSVLEAKQFTEKPDQERAERFLRQGDHFWNSGMFIWRVDTILREIKRHMPDLYAGLMRISDHLGTGEEEAVIKQVYARQASISIDVGVMEKSDRVKVIPTGEIGWSDVGDWSALEAVVEKDTDRNVILANHLGIDTTDSVIFSQGGKTIATVGISDVIIVDTGKALLVMDKRRAQEVKKLAQLQEGTNKEDPA